MKNIRFYITSIIIAAMISVTYGQDNQGSFKYSAVIVDENNETINGAAVISSIYKERRITDANGLFELTVGEEDFVSISYKGFELSIVEVDVTEQHIDTIMLYRLGQTEPSRTISIAQGSLPFERITGSIERITGDELKDFQTIHVREALSGRVSGVTSYYLSGDPIGESFALGLRGSGLGNVYVDGVIADITETPEEINDIIIAKDYGSGFLFGGNSAYGSMIINTKKGISGQKLLQFKAKTGVRNPTFTAEMMNSSNYATHYNQALISDGLEPIYSQEAIDAYGNGSNPIKYPDNNYQKLMNSPSYYTHVSGNFAGGNNTVNYFSHVGYYGTNGIESVGEGSNLTRLRIKNNVEVNFSKYGKLDIGIGASFKQYGGPSSNEFIITTTGLFERSIFGILNSTPPNAFPYQINDSIYGRSYEHSTNPMVSLAHSSIYETTQRDAYSRVGLELDLNNLLKGLTFSGLYNIYVLNDITQKLHPSVDMAEPDFIAAADGSDSLIHLRRHTKGIDDAQWSKTDDFVVRVQYLNAALNFNRDFSGNHSIKATAFINKKEQSGSQLTQKNIIRDIGARINYMLYNKYVIEGNLVNSAVRQMSKSERNRLSYAGGVAWLLHKESFLSNITWLNLLKLRANYGTQAIPISQFYLTDNLYARSGTGRTGNEINGISVTGYFRNFTASPNLVLPKLNYLSVGADYSIFNKTINGQINYFNKRTQDVIINPTASYAIISSNSSYLPLINYGDARTSGFDGRISYRTKVGEFNLLIDGNAMHVKSYVSKSNNVDYPEEERNVNGNFTNRIVGLDSDGIFQSEEEIAESTPQLFGIVRPGDIKYKDHNDDGVIDFRDYHEIAKTPSFFYGLNFAVNYKSVTISVHGDGVAGGYFRDYSTFSGSTENYTTEMENSWPQSNELPRITTLGNNNNWVNSTFWLKKAGYFNLRNINLSYRIPQRILQKTVVKDLSLYLSAKNVHVFSKHKHLYMPARGKGDFGHPVLNAYEIGLEISF